MKRLFCICLAALSALASLSCKKDNPGNGKKKVPMPKAVDMGIIMKRADGTTYNLKWASFNLGASKEYEYGNYYAWGETAPKNDYTWETYVHANGADNRLTKYCMQFGIDYWDVEGKGPDNESKLLPSDDAAHVNLGGKWRMPTVQEWAALDALEHDEENYSFEWYIPLDENGDEILDDENMAIH